MRFQIKRVWVGDEGCYGVMFCERKPPFALTLERTFRPDNAVVIKRGVHRCTKTTYYKGQYPTYEIEQDGHTRVLFHRGNIEMHSLGCVLIGEYFHDFKDMSGIANSAGGFAEFMRKTKGVEEFELEVT